MIVRTAAAATLAAAVGAGAGAPAQASGTTISIDPADVGQTAAAFPVHKCDPALGGGPFAGEDVWVFALPRPKQQGDFRSVTIVFATEGGPVTETITTAAAGDRAIVDGKAWIRTPAGLTAGGELLNPFSITSATAVITGADGTFDLLQTCPATGGASRTALPITGSADRLPTGGLAAAGGALLVVGAALAALHRRRRSEEA